MPLLPGLAAALAELTSAASALTQAAAGLGIAVAGVTGAGSPASSPARSRTASPASWRP